MSRQRQVEDSTPRDRTCHIQSLDRPRAGALFTRIKRRFQAELLARSCRACSRRPGSVTHAAEFELASKEFAHSKRVADRFSAGDRDLTSPVESCIGRVLVHRTIEEPAEKFIAGDDERRWSWRRSRCLGRRHYR